MAHAGSRAQRASDTRTQQLPAQDLQATQDVGLDLFREPRQPKPPARPSQRMSAYEKRQLPYMVLGWLLVVAVVLLDVGLGIGIWHLMGRHL